MTKDKRAKRWKREHGRPDKRTTWKCPCGDGHEYNFRSLQLHFMLLMVDLELFPRERGDRARVLDSLRLRMVEELHAMDIRQREEERSQRAVTVAKAFRPYVCYICRHNERHARAVAICNELNKPVCEEHAKWCVKEEHGHRPLPERVNETPEAKG